VAFAGAFIHGIILWSLIFHLPLYFEAVLLRQPLQAVKAMLPLILTVSPMAIVSALIVEWSRRYGLLNRVAWVLLVAGLGTMALLGVGTSKAVYSVLQIPVGLGAGILYTGLALGVQASMNADDVGVATGVFVFFRNLGSVFGVAIGSSVFANAFDGQSYDDEISSLLPGLNSGNAIELIPRLRSLNLPAGLTSEVLGVYTKSFRLV
jgi:hypothetical protein